MNDLGRLSVPPSRRVGAEEFNFRLMKVVLPASTLQMLLTLDGHSTYRMEGWPKDAKIVGTHAGQHGSMPIITLYLYHPDFPPVLHGEPPEVEIKVTHVG